MRMVLRHGLASAAAVLTILMFALAGAGQASSVSGVRLKSIAGSSTSMELELFSASGKLDFRTWVNGARSGATERDHTTFMVRLSTRAANREAVEPEVAECTWSDERQVNADCRLDHAPDEAPAFTLTVERGRRLRETVIILDRIREQSEESLETVRLRLAM